MSVATVALLGAPALAHAAQAPFTPPDGVGDYRLLFVTNGTFDATSTDIADYNTDVTTEAGLNSSLPSTLWTAVVSTPTVNAVTNISCGASCNANVPIYLVDGTLVATSAAAMFQGTFSNLPGEDQFGAAARSYVWTGSNADGTADSGYEMGGTSGTVAGSVGGPNDASDTAISDVTFLPQNLTNPLYAISAEITVADTAMPEPASSGAMLAGGIVAAGLLRRRRTVRPEVTRIAG